MTSETEYRAIIGALLEHLESEHHNDDRSHYHCQTCLDMKRADKLLQNLDTDDANAVAQRREFLEKYERRKSQYTSLPDLPHARKRS